MTKKLHIFIFLLFVYTTSNAQGFEAKIITGAAASQIDGDGYGGYNQLGGILGGATNFYFSDEISFQQEICYYGRGSRRGSNQGTMDFFNILGLHFIDFNGVANYYLNDYDVILHGGLGGGIVIYERTDAVTNMDYRPDWYALAGIGYKFSDNVIGNARIQYSLFPFIKGYPLVSRLVAFHTNSISFSLHFIISQN